MIKYKVYFDKDTGNILAVANIEMPYETVFEVDYEDIVKFVDGYESISTHQVVYNINTSSYVITPKDTTIETLVDDLIYKITPRNIYQIAVWQDNIKQCWSIRVSAELQQQLTQVISRQNERLTFSITQKNNPNILYRHLTCYLNDILDQGSVDFQFDSQDEENLKTYSVYTNRKFEKYTCGVIDVNN